MKVKNTDLKAPNDNKNIYIKNMYIIKEKTKKQNSI